MTLSPDTRITRPDGQPFSATEAGSLGLLALGYPGLCAWRKARGLAMPPSPRKPRPTPESNRTKCLLIGWDAADWQIIKPMMENGEMPTLSRLVESGVMGNLATLEPSYSPMLWSTIATGMYPDKHGVLGFSEPIPESGGVRPVSGASRKVKAVWNILMQEGYRVHTVGWWPSHPAEPLSGVSVSNHFHRSIPTPDGSWPMADHTVHPEAYSEFMAALRIHPAELTDAHLLPFVPAAGRIDQDKDQRLFSVAKIIAEAATIQSAATWIMTHEEWDFLGVYFDAIDHFCHGFMKYHPPRLPETDEKSFALYKDVVRSGYRLHDMMLEQLLELAGPETRVILVSDHGFHATDLRPRTLPSEPAAPALQHRQYGIIAAKGPGIIKDELVFGANLIDIAPTILKIFDLPVGDDMDGLPLLQMFEDPASPRRIPSWEQVAGHCGMLSPDVRQDPVAAQEELRQMVALGYLSPPDPDKNKAAKEAEVELRHNLGRVYLGTGRPEKALGVFDALCKERPDVLRFQRLAIRSAIAALNLDGCRERIERLKASVMPDLLSDTDLKHFQAMDHVKGPDAVRVRKSLLTRRELLQLELLDGDLYLAENSPQNAVACYERVAGQSRMTPALQLKLGNALRRAGRLKEASAAYEHALHLDPDHAHGFLGLSQTRLQQSRFEDAADAALSAISLLFHFPAAHYTLGESLFHLGDHPRSAQAFETCLAMSPNHGAARNRLIFLCETRLDDPEKADGLKAYFTKQRGDSIRTPGPDTLCPADVDADRPEGPAPYVIVSGLPRSGTSMMMQMLSAGGMTVFTDDIRKADASNVHGYFEHEGVKRLPSDTTWLKDARNTVVKVLTPLLFHLPDRYPYDVIFMVRDRDAVFDSQEKMIRAKGEAVGDREKLHDAFDRQYRRAGDWARRRANVRMHFVRYEDVLEDPDLQSRIVQKFLSVPLDIHRMTGVVDAPGPTQGVRYDQR